jgi:hypothetical protein
MTMINERLVRMKMMMTMTKMRLQDIGPATNDTKAFGEGQGGGKKRQRKRDTDHGRGNRKEEQRKGGEKKR